MLDLKCLLLFIVLTLYLGCTSQEKSWCVFQEINLFKREFDYDFIRVTKDTESYLLRNNFIASGTKASYIDFFKNKEYCSIDPKDLTLSVRNNLANPPSIAAAYIKCGLHYDNAVKVDFLDTVDYSIYLPDKIERLTDRQFEYYYTKGYFIMMVWTLSEDCNR